MSNDNGWIDRAKWLSSLKKGDKIIDIRNDKTLTVKALMADGTRLSVYTETGWINSDCLMPYVD